MKKSLFTLLLLCLVSFSFGQNVRPVPKKLVSEYSSKKGYGSLWVMDLGSASDVMMKSTVGIRIGGFFVKADNDSLLVTEFVFDNNSLYKKFGNDASVRDEFYIDETTPLVLTFGNEESIKLIPIKKIYNKKAGIATVINGKYPLSSTALNLLKAEKLKSVKCYFSYKDEVTLFGEYDIKEKKDGYIKKSIEKFEEIEL